jgi:ATP phosphoribosyltransferase regulatory subunit
MVDILPGEAARRAFFARTLVDSFARFGYDLVTTPLFEFAQVLERGLNSTDRRSLLRFVEPESGSVALMRPDITPQVARIAATRLNDRPTPLRLAYQGTIIRKPQGRARSRRQFGQAGVELIGIQGVSGDAEVIEAATSACREVGLGSYVIELGQVRIPNAALASVPEGARAAASAALAAKDPARLESLLKAASVASKHRRDLLRLTELFGDISTLRRGRAIARRLGVEEAIDELSELHGLLVSRELGGSLSIDLGELRGQSYYTGASYQLLAAGPGEPIGSGGRYDDLVGRFGRPMPATGFGLDLEHLLSAIEESPTNPSARRRFVVAALGGNDTAPALRALRNAGLAAADFAQGKRNDALAFAKSWGYDAVLLVGKTSIQVMDTHDEPVLRYRAISALIEAEAKRLKPEEQE